MRRLVTSITLTLTIVNAMVPIQARAADESTAATVLTLNPAFFPLPSNWLRGELFDAPNVKVKVPYTNLPNAYFVHQGADALDRLLHSTPGP